MNKITINEIVEILKGEGFEISRRTFWYYIEFGLLDKPETIKAKKGVQGFYGSGILEPLRKVLSWRDAGHPLKELKGMLIKDTIDEIDNIFEKHGLENALMPEYFSAGSVNAYNNIFNNVIKGIENSASEKDYIEYHKAYKVARQTIMSAFLDRLLWSSYIEKEEFILFTSINRLKKDFYLGYLTAFLDSSDFIYSTIEKHNEDIKKIKNESELKIKKEHHIISINALLELNNLLHSKLENTEMKINILKEEINIIWHKLGASSEEIEKMNAELISYYQ